LYQGDELAQTLLERVRAARGALAAAVESADSTAMPAALDELERALLLARENGIDVTAAADGPDEKDGS
jgi:hypothetical protein